MGSRSQGHKGKRIKYVKLPIQQYNQIVARSNFCIKIVDWLRKKKLWKKVCQEFQIPCQDA